MSLKNKRCKDCNKKLKGYYAKRCHSCSSKYKFKIKGNWLVKKQEQHPNYKDGRSLKKYYCKDCNKKISNWSGIYGKGRCWSCSKKGKLHSNYIHGQGYFPYPLQFSDKLKSEIKNRDNYLCQNCGITEEEHLIVFGEILSIHHIDYNKNNNRRNNLITLCKACNCRANYNRFYWKQYFEGKINVIRKN